jgi:hypothetical protein
MPHFSVMLHGKGVLVPALDGSDEPMIGFFTTRVVTARDVHVAQQAAAASVAKAWTHGRYASSNRGSPPVLVAERTIEVSWFSRLFKRSTGYAFYTSAEEEESDASSAV